MRVSRASAVCLLISCVALAVLSKSSAQGEWESAPMLDMYIRFRLWAQVWLRATQMGPGSVVDGSTNEWQLDGFLRRARFLTYAQLTDRVLIRCT